MMSSDDDIDLGMTWGRYREAARRDTMVDKSDHRGKKDPAKKKPVKKPAVAKQARHEAKKSKSRGGEAA
jgi:hypothetical protein